MATADHIVEIERLYRSGKTLQEIGDVYGVTRERIRQLLRRDGIERDFGGAHIRTFVRCSARHAALSERRQKRVRKIEEYCGCDYETVLSLCGDCSSPWTAYGKRNGSPAAAFMQQKRNAAIRGIGWDMSLIQWWRIWQESGKWELRGRGRGRYGMARLGDSGPYRVDNVYITETVQNSKDFYAVAANKAAWKQKQAAGYRKAA